MRPLTTSIYTFSNLINEGFLYVDKSAGLYDLVKRNGQYFLARPRRFGKSLMISTLKAIFQGQRELFNGLAIDKQDYDWQSYPVIHLDMGSCAAETTAEIKSNLFDLLDAIASDYKISIGNETLPSRFKELIDKLSKNNQKVVILVDEYDKPLLNHIGKESAKEIQNVLKNFYSVIKTTEPYQRFALITGVSKFSKVSIFSDLNNLTDLTMQADAATLLGYTQEELEKNFGDYIEAVAEAQSLSKDECLNKLKLWYNGYRFHQNTETVYNPVSVMKCFIDKEFRNYWFETGTPTFLVDLLKKQPVDLTDIHLVQEDFSVYEPDRLSAIPILIQTGYLTIKSSTVTGIGTEYEFGFPNLEVSTAFSRVLAKGFSEISDDVFGATCRKILQAVNDGDVDKMLSNMAVLFSEMPYDITVKSEKYYQSLLFFILKMLGSDVDAEVRNHIGRMDCRVKTKDYIYVMEFKLNGTAEEALQQIDDKQYAVPYANDPRKLFKIGVEFSKETRNIDRWLVQAN